MIASPHLTNYELNEVDVGTNEVTDGQVDLVAGPPAAMLDGRR
jgi:hypothetical protein